MIKFFRHIRKQLLSENKTGKYFKYAVGEIVLVVIGILIALSINNWNENRLEARKEIEILIELNENLTQDINKNKFDIERQRQDIIEIKKLISYIEAKVPYNDTLNNYIRNVGHLEGFHINTSAYETLKSLGLELISSKSLKNEIRNYYDVRIKGRYNIVDRLNAEQRDDINQARRKFKETYDGPQEMFSYYLATNGRFYLNYLHSRIIWKNDYINDICTTNYNQAEKLISSIDNELIILND
jgi:hypothetical protein